MVRSMDEMQLTEKIHIYSNTVNKYYYIYIKTLISVTKRLEVGRDYTAVPLPDWKLKVYAYGQVLVVCLDVYLTTKYKMLL